MTERITGQTDLVFLLVKILPIKSKMAAAKKQCFLRFLYWTESSPTVIQSPRFTNDFGISVNTYQYISSRHSNLSFAHHFVIYWLFQNGANMNQHQKSHQRGTIPDKFVFFFFQNWQGKKKKLIWWAKYMYVCKWDMCWRNFCNFFMVTKKCEK